MPDRLLGLSRWKTVFHTRQIKQANVSWNKFSERLAKSAMSIYSYDEYMAAPRDEQLKVKDAPGFFIGGRFKHDERLKDDLLYRDILALDLDHLDNMDCLFDVRSALELWAYVIYSTQKHCEDSPRLRLVIPLGRSVSPQEYEVLGRCVADEIGIDYFDDTTYQSTRAMFFPGHCHDVEPFFEDHDGHYLEPDEYLEWITLDDPTTWPISSREAVPTLHDQKVEWSPGKRGAIGAFCRAYLIPDVIAAFDLPYEATDSDSRYTYTDGTSSEGAVVYDDWTQMFSNHESDPAHGHSVNAYDLVRIHEYGDLDPAEYNGELLERPSMLAMTGMVMEDPKVLAEIDDPAQDFDGEEYSVDAASGQIADQVNEKVDVVLLVTPFAKLMQTLQDTRPIDRDIARRLIGRANLLPLTDVDIDLVAGQLREGFDAPKPTLKALKSQLQSGRASVAADDLDLVLIERMLNEHYEGGLKLKRVARIFWNYESGYWAQVEEEVVKSHMNQTVTKLRVEQPDDKKLSPLVADVLDRRTSMVTSGIWDMTKSTLAGREARDDPLRLLERRPLPLVNCENGELQFDYQGNYVLQPHDPDHFLTHKIATTYDPEAECPLYDAFTAHVFHDCMDPEEMERHLDELLGYILGGSRWLKTWVLFHGETNTGKSTVLSVLQALLGSACLAQELAAYGAKKNQFAESNLLGMLLLADDDFEKAGSLPDGFLKKISEEKMITSEIKYGGKLAFISRAVPLICANHWPVTRDVSTAFRERALVFHFPTAFSAAERSDEVRDRMLSELPGILNRCVAGLKRLRSRGAWDVPIDGRAAAIEWESNSNAIMLWLAECTEKRTGEHMGRAVTWKSFTRWCAESNTQSMKKAEFFSRMEQVLGKPYPREGIQGWGSYTITRYALEDGAGDFE